MKTTRDDAIEKHLELCRLVGRLEVVLDEFERHGELQPGEGDVDEVRRWTSYREVRQALGRHFNDEDLTDPVSPAIPPD